MSILTEGAWVQEWEESEAGWGCRPDGYYYYPTEEAASKDTKQRLEDMRAFEAKQGYGTNNVPSCYSRPCGSPRFIPVTSAVAAEIAIKGHIYRDKPLVMKQDV